MAKNSLCMRATNVLRYVRRAVAIGEDGHYHGFIFVLQQEWQDMGNGARQWIDVPVIDETTGGELPTEVMFFGQSPIS